MNVSDLMTKDVRTCSANDNLQRAAQIMWESDCGVVPVVDSENRVIGIVTDRDIAMGAYTQGQTLWQIPVSKVMAKQVHPVHDGDRIDVAEDLMRRVRVRRVPVLDGEGRLKGILSLNDLARHAHGSIGRKADGLNGDSIAKTLAAICEPPARPKAKEPANPANPVNGKRPQPSA